MISCCGAVIARQKFKLSFALTLTYFYFSEYIFQYQPYQEKKQQQNQQQQTMDFEVYKIPFISLKKINCKFFFRINNKESFYMRQKRKDQKVCMLRETKLTVVFITTGDQAQGFIYMIYNLFKSKVYFRRKHKLDIIS